MSLNPFQRRPKSNSSDSTATEFPATVAAPPPELSPLPTAPDSLPSDIDPGHDFASDSSIDSQPAPVELRPTIAFVGRYALKNLLGTGGLGQVHEAWDPILSRAVAVKTLQFDSAPEQRQSLNELFLNEARAVAGLSHAHIVTVHDAGLSDHGVYIAMERLQGQDLRQRLAGGWIPTPVQAAQLVRRVADALSYAHARGVVHCDIKPANIFLNKRDRPKVLDFGIARIAHTTVLPQLQGAVAGSPHYLAPEQLQGGPVDARTDIHALGVVFYELLTLRKAFSGDSVEQITTAVLTNHPAPAHEVRPGVPRTLAGIAAKAMARDPGDRYGSAAEMAADLRRWADKHDKAAGHGHGHGHGSSHRDSAPDASGPPSAPAVVVMPGSGTIGRPQRRRPSKVAPVGYIVAAAAVGAGALALVAYRSHAPSSAPQPVPLSTPASAALPAASAASAGLAASAPEGAASAAAEGPASAAVPTSEPAASVAAPVAAPVTAPVAATPPAARAAPAPAPARTRAAAAPRESKAAAPAAVAPAPVMGVLQLAISPWGQVEIDGRAVGTTPPLTRLELPEGSHTVTIRNDDAPPLTLTVQVSADKPITVRHRFAQ